MFEEHRSSRPGLFSRKGIFKNFAKFTGKHQFQRPLSYRNQSTDLLCKSMDWFLYDRGLWRKCFPVNFAKFLILPTYLLPPRMLFFTEHLRRLLLKPSANLNSDSLLSFFFNWNSPGVYY